MVEGRLERCARCSKRPGVAGQPGAPPTSLPLRRFPDVHFARIFVLEAATLQTGREVPASLVYMADVDGSVDEHLRALVDHAPAGCRRDLRPLRGLSRRSRERRRAARLAARRIALTPAAYYVHTVGRTVQQIRDEARLYRDAR